MKYIVLKALGATVVLGSIITGSVFGGMALAENRGINARLDSIEQKVESVGEEVEVIGESFESVKNEFKLAKRAFKQAPGKIENFVRQGIQDGFSGIRHSMNDSRGGVTKSIRSKPVSEMVIGQPQVHIYKQSTTQKKEPDVQPLQTLTYLKDTK